MCVGMGGVHTCTHSDAYMHTVHKCKVQRRTSVSLGPLLPAPILLPFKIQAGVSAWNTPLGSVKTLACTFQCDYVASISFLWFHHFSNWYWDEWPVLCWDSLSLDFCPEALGIPCFGRSLVLGLLTGLKSTAAQSGSFISQGQCGTHGNHTDSA